MQNIGNVAELLNKVSKQTYESAEACVKTNYNGTKAVTEALLPCLLLSNSARIVMCQQVLESLRYVNVTTPPPKGNSKTKFILYNALVLSRISIYNKINAEFFLDLFVCLQRKG